MKKILIVLLSLVSLFSLTSCDLFYDSETQTYSFDKIIDFFNNFGSSSSTSGCKAEGEYVVRKVEVYSYWDNTYSVYGIGDYYYGMWLSEDTVRVRVDYDGNVEGKADYSEYETIHFYGRVEEISEGSYFIIILNEPCDFGFNIEPYHEMYVQQVGDDYIFKIDTSSNQFIYYLEKR